MNYHRELVASPYDVQGGDRVELLDHDDLTKSAVIDLLWRDHLFWFGVVVESSAGSMGIEGRPVVPGVVGCIEPAAYPLHEVFVRRRSREGSLRDQAYEVSRG